MRLREKNQDLAHFMCAEKGLNPTKYELNEDDNIECTNIIKNHEHNRNKKIHNWCTQLVEKEIGDKRYRGC